MTLVYKCLTCGDGCYSKHNCIPFRGRKFRFKNNNLIGLGVKMLGFDPLNKNIYLSLALASIDGKIKQIDLSEIEFLNNEQVI